MAFSVAVACSTTSEIGVAPVWALATSCMFPEMSCPMTSRTWRTIPGDTVDADNAVRTVSITYMSVDCVAMTSAVDTSPDELPTASETT